MTEQAAEWSERDLDRRFELGEPHDELTRLAATLDRLLDRLAASLRHEQRFTAELSHELRTPLARSSPKPSSRSAASARRSDYQDALEAIDRNADEMTRTVETLVAAARHEAGLTQATSDLREAVTAAAETRSPTPDGIEIQVALPRQPVRVRSSPTCSPASSSHSSTTRAATASRRSTSRSSGAAPPPTSPSSTTARAWRTPRAT